MMVVYENIPGPGDTVVTLSGHEVVLESVGSVVYDGAVGVRYVIGSAGCVVVAKSVRRFWKE